jgi:hypothetical protein
MKSYKKNFCNYNPTRKFNDLTKDEAYSLELEIYKRVSGNKNFPEMISYNDKKKIIELEHCGKSLSLGVVDPFSIFIVVLR